MMQTISPLSIARSLILSACLLGVAARGAIAQSLSSLPPPAPSRRSDSAPSPEGQFLFSSSMTPSPIISTCPFPAIPLSSAAEQTIGFGGFEIGSSEVHVGETFSPGDNSDPDLSHRVYELANEGKLDEALSLTQTIHNSQLRIDALLRIAQGYATAEQPDQALAIVQSLPATAEPTFRSREQVLGNIATAYRNQGHLEQAVQVAEQMDEGRSMALREIAMSYAAQGQRERAVEVLSQAVTAFRATAASPTRVNTQDIPPSFVFMILTIFASDYLDLSQNDQAVELLDEALANAKALPEVPFLIGFDALSSFPLLYRKAGQDSRASETLAFVRETAEHYQQPITRSSALIQTALIYLALQQPNQTTELLTQAEAVAQADQTAAQENIIWVNLARAYAVLGQYDRAFQAIAPIQPASLRDQVNQTLVCSQQAR